MFCFLQIVCVRQVVSPKWLHICSFADLAKKQPLPPASVDHGTWPPQGRGHSARSIALKCHSVTGWLASDDLPRWYCIVLLWVCPYPQCQISIIAKRCADISRVWILLRIHVIVINGVRADVDGQLTLRLNADDELSLFTTLSMVSPTVVSGRHVNSWSQTMSSDENYSLLGVCLSGSSLIPLGLNLSRD